MNTQYLTVYALNRYLKAKIDSDIHLNHLWVQGELSNVKYHYSGHCYFTLKDERSRINAVIFSSQLKKIAFRLEDGMKVFVLAKLSVYEPQGSYQLYVENIQIDGVGQLYLTYEKLRQSLEKEGLFDPGHKKKIPDYPEKIGVITALSGAAIHDITKTIRQKCPSAAIFFYPSLVQGETAPADLIKQLERADRDHLDVLIIGRGGGSLEDLWAFNNEQLARAIYHAQTPIVSGVGHESDVTICDFVADYRAATPTAAAHAAVFSQDDLSITLDHYENRMAELLTLKIQRLQHQLELWSERSVLARPQLLYAMQIQRLDQLSDALSDAFKIKLSYAQAQEKACSDQMINALSSILKVELLKQKHYLKQLEQLMTQALKHKQQHLGATLTQLNALNPLNILERGYTVTMQNDQILTSIQEVNVAESLVIHFKDGDLPVVVKEDGHEKTHL